FRCGWGPKIAPEPGSIKPEAGVSELYLFLWACASAFAGGLPEPGGRRARVLRSHRESAITAPAGIPFRQAGPNVPGFAIGTEKSLFRRNHVPVSDSRTAARPSLMRRKSFPSSG